MIWLCFILACCCCLMNWGVIIQSHINAVISNPNIIALIFLIFSSKYYWHIIAILRSSRLAVLCKNSVLKHFAKFIGKQLCQSLFSYKISGQVERRLRCLCFPIKFAKFSITSFLKSTSGFSRKIFVEIINLFLLFVSGFLKIWSPATLISLFTGRDSDYIDSFHASVNKKKIRTF